MYDFKTIEKKWQDKWEKEKTFKTGTDKSKKKFYGLVEFPYPSGAGMHIGHVKAYSGLEVISRKRRMEGYNVLFPIGLMHLVYQQRTMLLKLKHIQEKLLIKI